MDFLRIVDPEIWRAVRGELQRQEEGLELIASENYCSLAVQAAQGSCLTNKYAEGYPKKRYYGGCEMVDIAEALAIERVKEIFKAEHANVQPHSGSQANMAVYFSVLKPGSKILSMDLAHGGHLTHGFKKNFSGIMYDKISYGVERETGMLDYEKIKGTAHRHNPDLIIAGASAYSRAIDFVKFREIADEVGALFMVDMAHIAGLIATGLHPDPVPYADFVTSTTHKTLRGPRGGLILCKSRWAAAIDESIFPGTQGGPLMHVIAAKAVAFKEAMTPEFKEYSAQVIRNAQTMARELQERGFNIVSGGTDNHLFLVDLNNKNITGKEAERRLGEVGITVNKNFIPFDERNAYETSGIRIGTPAITTRHMKEPEMAFIAQLIEERLCGPQTEAAKRSIVERVRDLCMGFPVYRMPRRMLRVS